MPSGSVREDGFGRSASAGPRLKVNGCRHARLRQGCDPFVDNAGTEIPTRAHVSGSDGRRAASAGDDARRSTKPEKVGSKGRSKRPAHGRREAPQAGSLIWQSNSQTRQRPPHGPEAMPDRMLNCALTSSLNVRELKERHGGTCSRHRRRARRQCANPATQGRHRRGVIDHARHLPRTAKGKDLTSPLRSQACGKEPCRRP